MGEDEGWGGYFRSFCLLIFIIVLVDQEIKVKVQLDVKNIYFSYVVGDLGK